VTTTAGETGGPDLGPTFPATVPVAVEADDPVGDPELSFGGGSSPGTMPPGQPLADITHVAAWISDGTLRAQVTLAGAAPGPDTPLERVGISVSHNGKPYDLPVCTSVCGSYFTVPRFSAAVTQLTGRWVVDITVSLDEIGAWAASHDSYQVRAQAGSAADAEYAWWWGGHCS